MGARFEPAGAPDLLAWDLERIAHPCRVAENEALGALYHSSRRLWVPLLSSIIVARPQSPHLGSTGAISEGSSAPLPLRAAFATDRRSYEKKERNSQLLEEEKKRAATQCAERHESSAACADSTGGACRQASSHLHEVRSPRLVKRRTPVRVDRRSHFPVSHSLKLVLSVEIDPRFGEIGEQMVCLTFFVEGLLKQLRL
jgi:hypothetical protein